ncbi:MAG: rhomboid family intramembrane serine protease [Pseudomonadota bacterium]
MIPLRDENPTKRFPWITLLLIGVNVGVFLDQGFLGAHRFDWYVEHYGVIPAALIGRNGWHDIPTLFSGMFMHGGFLHLLGNMWFLWIFGDNVEEKLGKTKFLIFYLTVGLLATLAHVAAAPGSKLPLVGASGAIAGVLGAYFLFFPFHRILTLVPIFVFITTIRIPAMVFLGLWFLMQIAYSSFGGNVAWWAHIGGFLSGLLLAKLF